LSDINIQTYEYVSRFVDEVAADRREHLASNTKIEHYSKTFEYYIILEPLILFIKSHTGTSSII